MSRYETVFILTPVLSDEQTKETVKKFRDLAIELGAKVEHDEFWGLRKLAYPIQKKSTGFYQLFELEAEGDFISKFEVELRRDERVIRFLNVKLDADAIAYAGRRRKKLADSSAN